MVFIIIYTPLLYITPKHFQPEWSLVSQWLESMYSNISWGNLWALLKVWMYLRIKDLVPETCRTQAETTTWNKGYGDSREPLRPIFLTKNHYFLYTFSVHSKCTGREAPCQLHAGEVFLQNNPPPCMWSPWLAGMLIRNQADWLSTVGLAAVKGRCVLLLHR